MYNPRHNENATRREFTDVFYGYDARRRIGQGYFNYTENLTTEEYPLLAPRKMRTVAALPNNPFGMLGGDVLTYVDGNVPSRNGDSTASVLFYNFKDVSKETGGVGYLTPDEKQLVRMGAWICVLPDKKAYNTATGEWKTFEAHYEGSYSTKGFGEGAPTFQMCHLDGTPYTNVESSESEPEDKTKTWIEIDSEGNYKAVLEYSESSGGWVNLNTVYTRINYTTVGEIPAMFKVNDVVDIGEQRITIPKTTHIRFANKRIVALGGGEQDDGTRITDYIVIVNPMAEAEYSFGSTARPFIRRTAPDLDFVCEAQNRLWGCKYGNVNGEIVNEIYCCALGDFTNWHKFEGLSTDSWVGSVGSPGEWTGCINYLGHPTFFKEGCIHIVSVSQVGAHRIDELPCRGVEKGSSKSLVMINEVLYYKSNFDFCRYSGNVPQGISDELAGADYHDCVAGEINGRYYVKCRGVEKTNGGKEAYHMFIYDTKRGLWIHEDSSGYESRGFATVGKSLFCALKYVENVEYKIHDLTDGVRIAEVNSDYSEADTWEYHEKDVKFIAQTGALYTEYPDNKYAIRFDIRVEAKKTGYHDYKQNKQVTVYPKLIVYVKYSDEADYMDDSKGWTQKGVYEPDGLKTLLVPITPHRCDTMKIKFVGWGDLKILSIAKILEVGSDV